MTNARWAISFADLCLLLLGFFILLQARAGDPREVTEGVRAALGAAPSSPVRRLDWRAVDLFEPGEAALRPAARSRLASLRPKRARVESLGRDGAVGRRFDGWELAAARTAAVARALRLPAERVELVMPSMRGPATGQRLRVTLL